MPFQEQWKGTYVCFRCAFKSNKRSISSSAKHHNSTSASEQSAGPPGFETEYFQSTPLSPIVTSTDRSTNKGSLGQLQGNNKEDQDATKPSPELTLEKRARNGRRTHLTTSQVQSITTLSRVAKKLSKASQPSASVEDAVKHILQKESEPDKKQFIDTLSKIYSGGTVQDVVRESSILQKLDTRTIIDPPTEALVAKLTRIGLLEAPARSAWHREARKDDFAPQSVGSEQMSQSSADTISATRKGRKAPARKLRKVRIERRPRHIEAAAAAQSEGAGRTQELDKEPRVSSIAGKEKHKFTSTLEASALSIMQLPRTGPEVPNLSHDLSRVLFNPGIYQLQDPRSRVYNFDPYLEKIMPVSEFDFRVLKEYITSSRDNNLRLLALEHGKKYVGSSSSMTSTLGQFHFLLSQWRNLNTESLSRGFSDTLKSFTIIQRTPSSVFLRYQDGVYAMDADKEHDSANILMSLGKSMEKLLTQRPQNFERYRKSSEVKIPEKERNAPEAYQYTLAGDLLMRAQLDAHDPRLPGTGTFDLKTRAVASIRHNVQQHEEGFGYQIKTRFGDWESYEREYFDMIRSAFLKYSLQVRLGQMDGIFVAFHNVERIFGFQYISLPEMDMALHGQYETTLGDQEFKFSVELLNQVLNRATERFPKRSLRLQFETRDLLAGGIFMQIFAEPMEEASIEAIQTSKREAIDAFEQRLMNPGKSTQVEDMNDLEAMYQQHKSSPGLDKVSSTSSCLTDNKELDMPMVGPPTNEQPAGDESPQVAAEDMVDTGQTSTDKASTDLDTLGTAQAPAETVSDSELLLLTLRVQNRVDGEIVKRPENLTSSQKWSLDYSLEEETRPQHARARYRASKARRQTALEQREENAAANYYLRKLRAMASSGAEWRKAQDELDAGRQRVVLYED